MASGIWLLCWCLKKVLWGERNRLWDLVYTFWDFLTTERETASGIKHNSKPSFPFNGGRCNPCNSLWNKTCADNTIDKVILLFFLVLLVGQIEAETHTHTHNEIDYGLLACKATSDMVFRYWPLQMQNCKVRGTRTELQAFLHVNKHISWEWVKVWGTTTLQRWLVKHLIKDQWK